MGEYAWEPRMAWGQWEVKSVYTEPLRDYLTKERETNHLGMTQTDGVWACSVCGAESMDSELIDEIGCSVVYNDSKTYRG